MEDFFPYIFQAVVVIALFALLKKRAFVPVLVFLALFNGFRLNIGNDYAQYRNIFNQIVLGNPFGSIELGFVAISKIGASLYGLNGYPLVFLFYSAVTYFFLFKALLQYRGYRWASLFVFVSGFIYYANNQIRQAAATAVFMYLLKFLPARKFPYVVGVVLAAIFLHFSALVLLFVIFVPSKPFAKSWAVLLVILSYLAYQTRLISQFADAIVPLLPYYGRIYADRFAMTQVSGDGTGLGVLFWILVALLIILNSDGIENSFLFNVYIIGTVINTIFLGFDILERVSFYLIYVKIILLGNLFTTKTMKKSHFGEYAAYSGLLVAYFLVEGILNKSKHGILPFHHLVF